MSDNPARWLDRLVGTCFSLLLAAIAVYAAVQLVLSVWQVLLLIVLVVLGLVAAVWYWRRRRSPW